MNFLMALRTARSLSQKDIADKLECSQGRISKLENNADGDLRIGDLQRYVSALGLESSIVLAKQGRTLVDDIKHHAHTLRRLLTQITSLAGAEGAMCRSALKVYVDLAGSLTETIDETTARLQLRPDLQRSIIELRDDETEQSDDPNGRPIAERGPTIHTKRRGARV
ncbi:MAG: helix-turn-helix domain-containing protein [Gemmataceae bacterium]|nr:helix-turn-helix domain-containing protein [Gemmataceae bacterium]